jgi:hypothetical protein
MGLSSNVVCNVRLLRHAVERGLHHAVILRKATPSAGFRHWAPSTLAPTEGHPRVHGKVNKGAGFGPFPSLPTINTVSHSMCPFHNPPPIHRSSPTSSRRSSGRTWSAGAPAPPTTSCAAWAYLSCARPARAALPCSTASAHLSRTCACPPHPTATTTRACAPGPWRPSSASAGRWGGWASSAESSGDRSYLGPFSVQHRTPEALKSAAKVFPPAHPPPPEGEVKPHTQK